MAKKHKIVIIGGGFAGVKAALELVESELFEVTLLSQYPEMRIYGSLYHTVTGGSKKVSTIPLDELFENKKINIIIGKATNLDRDHKTVHIDNGGLLTYDSLIIAIGVVTNYFGIQGLKEYSFGIKSLEEANELKKHLHDDLINSSKEDLHYIVVGGGPTGVEIAGVLPEYISKISKKHDIKPKKIHVDLVEAAPRLLPRMPKDISRSVKKHLNYLGVKIYLNTPVKSQTLEELNIEGHSIKSHTVIWTAGMTNNPFFSENGFQTTKNGRVRVDQYLQAEPDIYVLGDNADTPYSGMAQTALYDGIYLAKNFIKAATNIEKKPYKAKKPVYVMPAGPAWAAVLWGNIRLYGRVGWSLRRAADFLAYRDYEPINMAFSRFMAEYEEEESCPHCFD